MDKIKPVFETLNQELAQANLTLTIICVGAMSWNIMVCEQRKM